jgi:hypothetical protein
MSFSFHLLPDRADCARRIARLLAQEAAETRRTSAELAPRIARLQAALDRPAADERGPRK